MVDREPGWLGRLAFGVGSEAAMPATTPAQRQFAVWAAASVVVMGAAAGVVVGLLAHSFFMGLGVGVGAMLLTLLAAMLFRPR